MIWTDTTFIPLTHMFDTSQVRDLLRKCRHCTPPSTSLLLYYVYHRCTSFVLCHPFIRTVRTLALVWVPTTQAVGGKLQRVRDPELNFWVLVGPAKMIDRDRPAHTDDRFACPTKVTNTDRVPRSAISSREPHTTRTGCVLSTFIDWLCLPREYYPYATSRALGPKPNHFTPIIDWLDGSTVAI